MVVSAIDLDLALYSVTGMSYLIQLRQFRYPAFDVYLEVEWGQLMSGRHEGVSSYKKASNQGYRPSSYRLSPEVVPIFTRNFLLGFLSALVNRHVWLPFLGRVVITVCKQSVDYRFQAEL